MLISYRNSEMQAVERYLCDRSTFYPRDALRSAVYAVLRCLIVCHTPVFCLNNAVLWTKVTIEH